MPSRSSSLTMFTSTSMRRTAGGKFVAFGCWLLNETDKRLIGWAGTTTLSRVSFNPPRRLFGTH